MSNQYPSEAYRLAGEEWADLEAAASYLEDTKSAIMAQMQTKLGDMPVNRAEQIVKASQEWVKHVESIIDARKKANKAKINLEYARMKYYEGQSQDANRRTEIRMLGGTT